MPCSLCLVCLKALFLHSATNLFWTAPDCRIRYFRQAIRWAGRYSLFTACGSNSNYLGTYLCRYPTPADSTPVFPGFQHPSPTGAASVPSPLRPCCCLQSHLCGTRRPKNWAALHQLRPFSIWPSFPGRPEAAKPRKMGGRVFATGHNPLHTPRMPPAVYARAKEICHQALGRVFQSVATPIEGPGKQDYVRNPSLRPIRQPPRQPIVSNSCRSRATLTS